MSARHTSYRQAAAALLMAAGGSLIWLGLPRPESSGNVASTDRWTASNAPAAATVPPGTRGPESPSPEAQAARERAAARLRNNVQERVEAIRAAQEELRAGADPENVQAPVTQGR